MCEWSGNDYIATASVPDLNGNGSSEIASLYVDYVSLKTKVAIRDPKTDTVLSTLTFNTASQAPFGLVTLADINGNGKPEIGVAYLENNVPTVSIKDAEDDSAYLKTIAFLGNAYNFNAINVAPDSNGNGASEIIVLGTSKQTLAAKAEVRDSSTGEILDDTKF